MNNTYDLISFTYDWYHSGLTDVVQLVILMASLVLPMAGPVDNFGDKLWISLYNLWISLYNLCITLGTSCGYPVGNFGRRAGGPLVSGDYYSTHQCTK